MRLKTSSDVSRNRGRICGYMMAQNTASSVAVRAITGGKPPVAMKGPAVAVAQEKRQRVQHLGEHPGRGVGSDQRQDSHSAAGAGAASVL